ncbi:MAG: hypothetical protein HN348_10635 [Proteobacteria bacterium]|nr:hypothetical protein [Pseudomonadota bacterium]
MPDREHIVAINASTLGEVELGRRGQFPLFEGVLLIVDTRLKEADPMGHSPGTSYGALPVVLETLPQKRRIGSHIFLGGGADSQTTKKNRHHGWQPTTITCLFCYGIGGWRAEWPPGNPRVRRTRSWYSHLFG